MHEADLDPGDIAPPHEVRDPEKYAALTQSMRADGWLGRPLLVIDQQEYGGYQAWTGSHRIAAARKAELDTVPALVVELDEIWTALKEHGYSSAEGPAEYEEELAILDQSDLPAAYDLVWVELSHTDPELARWLKDHTEMRSNRSKPDLSTDEAYAVIEPYFSAVRERFEAAGYDLIARTRLSCDTKMHDSARHFAACRDDGRVILVAPELADLHHDTVLAILAHECGHAVDFLYPGEFVLDGRAVTRRDRDSETDKQWRKFLSAWKKRDDDTVELTADAIAEGVLGVPIGYRGPCMLQSFEGDPRPIGLR